MASSNNVMQWAFNSRHFTVQLTLNMSLTPQQAALYHFCLVTTVQQAPFGLVVC